MVTELVGSKNSFHRRAAGSSDNEQRYRKTSWALSFKFTLISVDIPFRHGNIGIATSFPSQVLVIIPVSRLPRVGAIAERIVGVSRRRTIRQLLVRGIVRIGQLHRCKARADRTFGYLLPTCDFQLHRNQTLN
jgi:hypothetical protein